MGYWGDVLAARCVRLGVTARVGTPVEPTNVTSRVTVPVLDDGCYSLELSCALEYAIYLVGCVPTCLEASSKSGEARAQAAVAMR